MPRHHRVISNTQTKDSKTIMLQSLSPFARFAGIDPDSDGDTITNEQVPPTPFGRDWNAQ
jgi:hypothetical protein